jgi:hypothetical protein
MRNLREDYADNPRDRCARLMMLTHRRMHPLTHRWMRPHRIMVQCRWISTDRLTDHSRYDRVAAWVGLLHNKSKPLVESHEPAARRCGGIIAFRRWLQADLRRIPIREIAKLPHDGRANALFSVVHDGNRGNRLRLQF